MLAKPDSVAVVLPVAAVLAIVLVLPTRHWSAPALAGLVGAAIAGAFIAVMWFVVARRQTLPPWSLHVRIGMGNVLVTVVVAIAATAHVNMANLYLLTSTFAILMFPVRAVVAHVAIGGACYAAVLVFGPATVEPPVVAWLAVFGTVAVVGAVVMGLVSVLRLAATVDPLTGLANRRAWDDRLDEEMERSRRTGTPVTVVLVDLDGFKAVNDRDGHAAGDHLLQTIAHAWQKQVRDGGDFLARIGGDEFAVLAPGTDEVGIRRLMKRFEEVTPAGVSFSSGEATWDRTERAPHLLRRADLAMYETKRLKRPRDGRGLTA
ncbi:GGDEF domain-containing protein [Demequina lutea]|uniref:Diguanylate cyclase (GGDEF)-like protein n=1 Tax=Demequina lutea TaxID=431489 RepID=A0A7Z0CLG5_9MICO|nr:GGDEF domain-containing protein [Demequina lutea]NYI42857.1 diguanylate cyclase (GGDEF)-like protein [Demequina lutea]